MDATFGQEALMVGAASKPSIQSRPNQSNISRSSSRRGRAV